MNVLAFFLIVGFLGSNGGGNPAPLSPPSGGGQASDEQLELENFLSQAKIVAVEKNVLAGRGAAWRVTLRAGDDTRRGFFKYVNSRRPAVIAISYRYEIAAYILSKLVGTPIVPPVVEREVEGRRGSLQIYLESCISEVDRLRAGKPAPGDPKAMADALDELTLFEGLTACARDVNDIMIHTDTGRLCRVDFAEAFNPSPELPAAAAAAVRCSRRLYKGLAALDPAGAEAALKRYLNPDEIQGVLARRGLILEKIKALIETKGEGAVLFSLAVPSAPAKKRP